MPDIQSVPSKLNNSSDEAAGKLVNLNTVLQNVLQQLSIGERNNIVLRCDALPFVHGKETDLAKAFSTLLHLVMSRKEDVSKLFLHIHCTPDKKELAVDLNFEVFVIQFVTNIPTCMDWLQPHEQLLTNAASILRKNGGSLTVNQIKNSGCVFSLSLPGKTL